MCKHVLTECNLVVRTANYAGSAAFRKAIDSKAKVLAVLKDEGSKETEGDPWISIACKSEQVVDGVIKKLYRDNLYCTMQFGDIKQTGPIVPSANASRSYVEFRKQLELPLFDRAISSKFPAAVTLWETNRMSGPVAEFASKYIYEPRKLRLSASAMTLEIDPKWASLVRKWLGVTDVRKAMDVIVLNVLDGTKAQTSDTKSYINVENAAVVMDLLILNHKEQAVDPKLIAIITPYKA